MSRSGYSDDLDPLDLGRWRGQVASAIRGRRGQAFLREMLAAMDALPDKRLIANELVGEEGEVCALGALGQRRGLDMRDIDPEDTYSVADAFHIPDALACEIEYVNDECDNAHYENVMIDGKEQQRWRDDTPEERFARVRQWVVEKIAVKP